MPRELFEPHSPIFNGSVFLSKLIIIHTYIESYVYFDSGLYSQYVFEYKLNRKEKQSGV